MPDFVTIDTGEVRIRAAIQGDGPLVILVHGFPESWWSWRHQIGPIADAGYKVAAIDVRGYGGSDKPPAVDAYGLQELSEDVSQVRQALQPNSPAILVGHDWGAPIVWTTALTRPDEFSAVAGLSVPWSGVPTRPFSDIYTETFTSRGQFFYQAWLQNVGPAEAEAERDVRGFLRKFYYALSGDAPQGTWPQKRHGELAGGACRPDRLPSLVEPLGPGLLRE
jgi:pimeloyl-ACP methyl ester carboxylesterase